MQPLYDMLAKAQDGGAMGVMARQYGLSAQQAQAALEALLPAFSQGLKRNASDPFGVGQFLSALSSGRHAEFYRNPQMAFSPQGTTEGNGILGHLFGSPEVSRAVAAQAAQATGIAQETFRQMLPALAAMIMGGLFQQSAPSAAPANPLQEMMERMMRAGGAAAAPRPEAPQPGENMFDNPFMEALNGMFGGSAGASAMTAANPFAKMFEEMMGGGAAQTAPEPPKNPSGRPRNTYDDLFGQMFETGRRTREDYEKSVAGVFEEFARKGGGG